MITLDEVAAFLVALPGVTETTSFHNRAWALEGSKFAWERPFSKADVKRYGVEPVPSGDIVAISTGDLHEKEAILAAGHAGVFTIPHFDGYAAVLVQLATVHKRVIRELLTDAAGDAAGHAPRRPPRRPGSPRGRRPSP